MKILRCKGFKPFALQEGERFILITKKWLGANKAANRLQTPHEHNEEGA